MISLGNRLKNAFAKSRFANPESAMRHVSLIAGGTVIAQAIGILTIPIVSRIYSPADYGIMVVYASVIAILGELSGFRYYLAIPLPKEERYAKALVVLSLGLQIIFVALLTLLLFVAGEFLLTKLSMPELIPYRALIPLGLLATGTYLVLTQWAIREKLFSTIARTKITQSLSGTVAKIGLGLLGVRPLGLLIGTIVAQGGGITTLLRSLLKKKGVPRPKRADIRRTALRYRKFPIYNTWAAMLNVLGSHIAPVLLLVLYNPQIAGLFAMGQQILRLPVHFVGEAIKQVFMQRASVARHQGGLKQLSLYTYCLLLQIAFFPVMIISFFAPQLFALFLGNQWIEAAKYAMLLGPLVAYNFAYSPVSVLYSILNRQNIGLYFQILHTLFIILAFWAGTHSGDPLISVSLYSAINTLVYFLRMLELLSAAGNDFRIFFSKTLRIIGEAFSLLLFPYLVFILDFHKVVLIPVLSTVSLIFLLRTRKLFSERSYLGV